MVGGSGSNDWIKRIRTEWTLLEISPAWYLTALNTVSQSCQKGSCGCYFVTIMYMHASVHTVAICGCRWHAHTCYVIGIWISLWVCVWIIDIAFTISAASTSFVCIYLCSSASKYLVLSNICFAVIVCHLLLVCETTCSYVCGCDTARCKCIAWCWQPGPEAWSTVSLLSSLYWLPLQRWPIAVVHQQQVSLPVCPPCQSTC